MEKTMENAVRESLRSYVFANYKGKFWLGEGESVEFGESDIGAELVGRLCSTPGLRWLWIYRAFIDSQALELLGESSFIGIRLTNITGEARALRSLIQSRLSNQCQSLRLDSPTLIEPGDVSVFAEAPTFPLLEECECVGMSLDKHGVEWLSRCPRLTRLSCDNSQLLGRSAALLANSRSIEILHLEYTSITDSLIEAIAKIPSLEQLFVGHTSLSDGCVPHLANISKLMRLRISGTSISARSLCFFGDKLKSLDLNFDHTSITNMDWLEALIVYGYGIDPQSLDRFRASGSMIIPATEDEEGSPCDANVIIGEQCEDDELINLSRLFLGEGNFRVRILAFRNSRVTPIGWYSAMSKIWGNSEPVVDVTEMTSPEHMLEAIGQAVNQSLMKSFSLRMRAEQLTESITQALDRFEENRVEVIVISGTVDRAFAERCRLSKSVASVECLEGVQMTVPKAVIEGIAQG
jgi:hypothetical protein